jgi:HEAT repeat protein
LLNAIQAAPLLLSYLKDNENNIRGSAATALGKIGSEKAVEHLINALSDDAKNVRGSAATALGRIGSEKAIEPLIKALNDEANNVRGSAATALGRIGSEKAVEPLIKALSDKASDVHRSATVALARIATGTKISHLDKVLDKIMKHLSEGAQEISPSGVRDLFGVAFRSADLKIINTALESAKKYLNLDEFFYLPYETALEYINSKGDPAIMDRQHPEMRDAVQLLVNLYKKGT